MMLGKSSSAKLDSQMVFDADLSWQKVKKNDLQQAHMIQLL